MEDYSDGYRYLRGKEKQALDKCKEAGHSNASKVFTAVVVRGLAIVVTSRLQEQGITTADNDRLLKETRDVVERASGGICASEQHMILWTLDRELMEESIEHGPGLACRQKEKAYSVQVAKSFITNLTKAVYQKALST